MQYEYVDFAKAVYEEVKDSLNPPQTFEEWDDENFWSTEPPPSDMTVCERRFIPCQGYAEPFLLLGEEYVKAQLSCTGGAWEIFLGDQFVPTATQYASEDAARAVWDELLKQEIVNG